MSAAIRHALLSCLSLVAVLFVRGDQTYAAAENTSSPTPDFSGVWLPNSRESGHWPEDRPFTQAMVDTRAQWAKANSPVDATVDDDHTSCLPYTLPYMMTTITQYPFEIVSTPRRIYLFTETYGQVRRIDIDGPAVAADSLPSRAGLSRGRWEGSTLVVETTNILPENEGSRFPSSPALRVLERISLQPGGEFGKQLIDEITVQDPRVYQKPIAIRMVYKWARDVQVGEYICEQDLWDQRLDGSTSKIPWRE